MKTFWVKARSASLFDNSRGGILRLAPTASFFYVYFANSALSQISDFRLVMLGDPLDKTTNQI
jgi:hypothetical protein